MSAQHTPRPWLVTYYNAGTGKRHTLIDDIDEATADAVVERFGDNGAPYNRMPEVRKERAAIAKGTTPGMFDGDNATLMSESDIKAMRGAP